MSDTNKPANAPSVTADGLPPRSIVLACYAIYTQLALAVLYAVLSWPLSKQLRQSIITSNKKAKAPKTLCATPHVKGCLDVNKTLHTIQVETAIGTALVAVIVAVMVQRIRRGMRFGRTVYVIVSLVGALVGFAGSPISLLAVTSSGPGVPRVVSALAAAASIVAIVLLFRPDSKVFFDLKSPRAAAAPAFGSLFKPRAPRERKPVPAAGLRSNAASRAQGRLAKAKSRNDAEAIARDAAVARNRSKASKSRRTDI